jgi:hypothetical protein
MGRNNGVIWNDTNFSIRYMLTSRNGKASWIEVLPGHISKIGLDNIELGKSSLTIGIPKNILEIEPDSVNGIFKDDKKKLIL